MRLIRSAGLFLAADVFLIAVHVWLYFAAIGLPLFDIALDRSYPEFYQYLKWYWLVCLSLYLGIRLRKITFPLLAPAFALLLIDDAFTLHEALGGEIASRLGLQASFNIRTQDMGELAFLGFSAIAIFMFWAMAYHFASTSARKHLKLIGAFLLLLGFFGGAMDAVHEAASRFGLTAYFLAGTLEDGGEMIVLSLLTGLLLRLANDTRSAEGIAVR
jgi:hypothetical protein